MNVSHETSDLGIGDPVEVRVLVAPEDKPGMIPEELATAREEWWPATVSHVSPTQIGVVFANSLRAALPRGRGGYRRP